MTETLPAPEVYDFARPSTLAREHARVLELAFETFARQWGTQLTAKVRAVSQVTCEQVQMTTYDEYAASLPALTGMVLLPITGLTPKGVLQVPLDAALTWVSHALGASKPLPTPDRTFTPIEQALVRKIVEDALDDLRYSFGGLLAQDVTVGGFQFNSQFAQAAQKGDLMIVASFSIRVGDRIAPGTLALPAEAVLPQLGEAAAHVSPADARAQLDAQLESVPVGVSLRFAPAAVLPTQVLRLAVGDVLPLPHPQHRPLTIAVDGEPVGTAAVGANGSRLAGIVVTTTSTEQH
ncbi:flagellar motor switch protein FliM [Curtobacterium flaccumfaciens]|uniref:flagellar motor switch protein FliM n=1 Tax=Curtobacterium flaccumfaciens TaxID=2035 RepID=UPI00188C0E63|nr:flagellar motor switch protein FliM [Curtobacterium flaccumfaciens]MBF4628659.1 flagellar motor switch protein FliM [Curtobacterium flaccumfaciens]MBO9043699.1 flagellar motor switch protein FliM [Curtobacterium flaccumfaciens pv. flaccumfaciens]MBO9048714.1 flagellar motor switch protein FliM [Curtobacterium flaccumfaciens pv. flaccumfaciens]MBO9049909.1 flagellar motor switch protein FliM [Curtobacterium flaccumfaciens pv. flaccumfaciens]QTR92419.1 flagellar motor switch protein FliM [Cur